MRTHCQLGKDLYSPRFTSTRRSKKASRDSDEGLFLSRFIIKRRFLLERAFRRRAVYTRGELAEKTCACDGGLMSKSERHHRKKDGHSKNVALTQCCSKLKTLVLFSSLERQLAQEVLLLWPLSFPLLLVLQRRLGTSFAQVPCFVVNGGICLFLFPIFNCDSEK